MKPEAEKMVVDLYAKLQNGRAVSRATGIHENTVYQILRRNSGACLRCGRPTKPGRANCEKCLEFDRDRMKVLRQSRIRQGLCVQCGEPRTALSRLYCEAHRIQNAERNQRSAQKLKRQRAGTPEGDAIARRQRLRRIRDAYGSEGVRKFEADGNQCEACRIPSTKAKILIHHIDEDNSNNTYGNFACLCFDCHKIAHQLLLSHDRRKAIRWFKRTYPDKPI